MTKTNDSTNAAREAGHTDYPTARFYTFEDSICANVNGRRVVIATMAESAYNAQEVYNLISAMTRRASVEPELLAALQSAEVAMIALNARGMMGKDIRGTDLYRLEASAAELSALLEATSTARAVLAKATQP